MQVTPAPFAVLVDVGRLNRAQVPDSLLGKKGTEARKGMAILLPCTRCQDYAGRKLGFVFLKVCPIIVTDSP